MFPIVLDTNVIVAALRSRRGASYALLRELGRAWVPLISVPLLLEYEAVGKREVRRLGISESVVNAIIEAFCFIGRETDIYFQIRPFLSDPADEFILELAVAGHAEAIVTHNVRHFAGVNRFGIQVLTPREFLRRIEAEERT